MALIQCPECGHKVSKNATSCPNCGEPVIGARETRGAGTPLTTVQATSKRFKVHKIISSVLFWSGVLWAVGIGAQVGEPDPEALNKPALLMAIGFIWYLVTRLRVWWHHH